MPTYNKGDFTQQGVDGYVEGGLHLNEKRCLSAKISSNEEAEGLDSVEINIHDHLNDLDYTITGENLTVGENVIGGGSSNEEYIILPESEYYIDGGVLPLISPLPEPFPEEIYVKMDNTSYIFERMYIEDEGFAYTNSDINNLIIASMGRGTLNAFPGAGESYQKTLEISVKREPRNYSIFTATLVNSGRIGSVYEATLNFDDFITDPPASYLYYLDNGEIKSVSDITIPPETSLTLDIILIIDEQGEFFQPLGCGGVTSNLINCTLNESNINFPEMFGAIINASGTITIEGAR